jgi:hypothetical protein
MNEPTINERISAALFIVAFGVKNTGVATCHKLMFPYLDYEDDDVKRVAARLLASVHTALLAILPQTQTEQILNDLVKVASVR